jgi:hypothetical protein
MRALRPINACNRDVFRDAPLSQLMNERSFVNAARVGGISKCNAPGILQQGARINSRRRSGFASICPRSLKSLSRYGICA